MRDIEDPMNSSFQGFYSDLLLRKPIWWPEFGSTTACCVETAVSTEAQSGIPSSKFLSRNTCLPWAMIIDRYWQYRLHLFHSASGLLELALG